MKLTDLHEDYVPDAGKGLSDAHYLQALNSIKNKELDKTELLDLSREFAESDKWDRTGPAAEFVLSRMHILIHGSAPDGETQARAETMFGIPQKMIDFAEKQGYDTFENIKKAKVDLEGRPVRVKEPQARQMMAQYYKDNKERMPKDIVQHRDDLIKSIMAGMKPEEAFAQFIVEYAERARQERTNFMKRKPKAKPTVTIDTLSGEDKATALDLAKKYNIEVLKTEGPIITFDLDRESLSSAVFLAKLAKEAQWDIV